MAEIYVTLDNLGRAMSRYDTIFKQWTEDKIKSYVKAITYDDQTHMLKFYTVPYPVPTGTVPYLQVEIPPGFDELEALFTVSVNEAAVPDQGKYKTYVFYQGTGAQKTEIGKISLDYDTVVESGSVVEATPQNPIIINGQTITEGKYLKLVIKNNVDPVYIALTDIGSVYTGGNGIDVDANAVITIDIDSSNANGLAVGANGLRLDLAVAPDVEHGIAGSAGAMSAEDKAILSSFSIATESQIRGLFNE